MIDRLAELLGTSKQHAADLWYVLPEPARRRAAELVDQADDCARLNLVTLFYLARGLAADDMLKRYERALLTVDPTDQAAIRAASRNYVAACAAKDYGIDRAYQEAARLCMTSGLADRRGPIDRLIPGLKELSQPPQRTAAAKNRGAPWPETGPPQVTKPQV